MPTTPLFDALVFDLVKRNLCEDLRSVRFQPTSASDLTNQGLIDDLVESTKNEYQATSSNSSSHQCI